MNKRLPCLEKFAKHSCYAWCWDKEKKRYFHECALMGCPFSESAKQLRVVGKTTLVGRQSKREHEWDIWKTTADQLGEYTPPWLYKRKCKNCAAQQMVEDMEKETKK